MLRSRLHEVEVVRPEERHPAVPGQVDRAPGLTVDLDPAAGSVLLDQHRHPDLHAAPTAFDVAADAGLGSDGAHQLGLAAGPRRRGEGEQRHRFQEVGLALAVGAQEEVEAWVRFELEPRIVSIVAKFEGEQPHMATRIGMIT